MNRPTRTLATRLGMLAMLVCVAASPEMISRASAAGPKAASRRAKDVSFDDIKFEMKQPKSRKFKRSMLTKAIEKLDDTPVRIRGYILPSFKQKGITQFVLVRDNMECCFGPGAALYDCIMVEMEKETSIEYTIRPVTVAGTFTIREVKGPDGKHWAVYHLQGTDVK